MIVYHGTSKENIKAISEDGISAPSYWTSSYEKALSYAQSWGDPIVLKCDTSEYDFRANLLVAQMLFDDNEIDEMPEEYNLENSDENFEGIVCHDTIKQFTIV